MRRAALIFVSVVAPLLAGCPTVPDHDNAWLSYKYSTDCGPADTTCFTQLRDTNAANRYYLNLGVPDPDTYTFDNWLVDSGFSSGTLTARAIYGNLFDLQFGREMNCAQSGQRIACYVANFGYPPMIPTDHGLVGNSKWPNMRFAIDEAVRTGVVIGTVAMIYDPSRNPNKVSFYAFGNKVDDNGELRYNALLYRLFLDQEGEKSVPRMCMACHGGVYDKNADTVTDAAFLPFDVFSFRYSDKAGYTFDEQQEELRALNAFVAATEPPRPILDLIDGLYPDGVNNVGSLAVDGWVPPGWSDHETLYTSVVRPYCRTCHLAQPEPFIEYSHFEDIADRLVRQICDKHSMPHAQIPYGISHTHIGFWNDRVAQHDLREFFAGLQLDNCMPDE